MPLSMFMIFFNRLTPFWYVGKNILKCLKKIDWCQKLSSETREIKNIYKKKVINKINK